MGPALSFLITILSIRYPGIGILVQQALSVIKSEHDVYAAVITSLEKYVPNGEVQYLELLKKVLDDLASSNAPETKTP